VRVQKHQELLLWMIPLGKPPSALEAVNEAMDAFPDTLFLANVSVSTTARMHIAWMDVGLTLTTDAWTGDPARPGVPTPATLRKARFPTYVVGQGLIPAEEPEGEEPKHAAPSTDGS